MFECANCNWRGEILQDNCEACPKCGHGELIDLDAVSEDDYRDQNPLEVPNE